MKRKWLHDVREVLFLEQRRGFTHARFRNNEENPYLRLGCFALGRQRQFAKRGEKWSADSRSGDIGKHERPLSRGQLPESLAARCGSLDEPTLGAEHLLQGRLTCRIVLDNEYANVHLGLLSG